MDRPGTLIAGWAVSLLVSFDISLNVIIIDYCGLVDFLSILINVGKTVTKDVSFLWSTYADIYTESVLWFIRTYSILIVS